MTFIDSTAKRTVSIVRKNAGAQNSSTGSYTPSIVTIQAGVECDIQPYTTKRGDVVRDDSGEEISADLIMFTATKISSDFRIRDIVSDGGTEYEIVAKRDWRLHWELLLRERKRS